MAKRGVGIALLLTAAVLGLWLLDRDAPDRTVAHEVPEAAVERRPAPAPGPEPPPAPGPNPEAEASDAPAPPDVDPEPGGEYVAGRVTDEQGRPMPAIKVVAETPGWYCIESTDANGRFRLRTRGSIASVGFATYPGPRWRKALAPVHVAEQVRPGTVGLVLTFRGIDGRVAGDDIRRGIVVARREGSDEPVAIAPLDEELHFAFYGLSDGTYRLSYKTDVAGSETMTVEGGRHVPAWRTGVILSLARGATIAGLVLDENGNPRDGVRLHATSGSIVTHGRTHEDGRFVVQGLERDREYSLTIWRAGYVPERREGIRPDASGVVFRLDPGLRATGRLADPRGEPIELAYTQMRTAAGLLLPGYRRTGPGGRFELAGLPDGMIEATFWKGERRATFTFRAGDRDLEFVLK